MNYFDAISSERLRWAAGIIGAAVLALLIFHAGMAFGTHRGELGEHEGRYERERGSMHPLFSGFSLPHGFARNNHGAVGTVVSVSLPAITVEARDGSSQTIVVGTSTVVRGAHGGTVSVGDEITVLGEPDDEGSIIAKFIRIISSSTRP